MRRVIIVERDMESRRVGLVQCLDIGNMSLGRYALFFSGQHDRCAMRVIGADVSAMMALRALKPDPYVGLYLLEHMPQVQRRICIG